MHHDIHGNLAHDERLEVLAQTDPATLAVTDRRILIHDEAVQRLVLDLPVSGIRRLQLDVERGRRATLVIVPHAPAHEPRVLAVPHEELANVTRLVAIVGDRLCQLDEGGGAQG